MEDVQRVMYLKYNIRNISIIGNANHGKSTIANHLICAAENSTRQWEIVGVVEEEEEDGEGEWGGGGPDRFVKGLTTDSFTSSLLYKITDDVSRNLDGEHTGNEYLIHLVDTPGHEDCLPEVAVSFHLTDGALLVVDCVVGITFQTKKIIQLAMEEKNRIALVINSMDRFFLELELDGEEAYQRLKAIIEDI